MAARFRSRRLIGLALGAAVFTGVGTVAVANGGGLSFRGGDGGGAALTCPRGMARLGHVFAQDSSVFPGDPVPNVEVVANIPSNGYLVEKVTTGTHTGTHLDSPGHFIEGGRTVDRLRADEFVWPAYVIDVRQRIDAPGPDDFELSVNDIRAYERQNGKIAKGSMVIIRTGFDAKFRTPAYLDPAPGFSGDAVNWLVAERRIGGVGSDTFGPDSTADSSFSATYNILAADRVALPGLNNLEALQVKGDIIIAPAVALRNGSGFEVDPIGCLGRIARSDRDDD